VRPDPQAARVYEMEAEEFSGIRKHRARLVDLREFSRVFCDLAEVPRAPVIRIGPSKSDMAGQYDPATYALELDRHEGLNGAVFAHELAHHITAVLNPRAADHGPLFVLRYGQILDLMRLLPLAGFRSICRKHNVSIARVRR
jgi:hypothetical protein